MSSGGRRLHTASAMPRYECMKTKTATGEFFTEYTYGMIHASLVVTVGLTAAFGAMKLLF